MEAGAGDKCGELAHGAAQPTIAACPPARPPRLVPCPLQETPSGVLHIDASGATEAEVEEAGRRAKERDLPLGSSADVKIGEFVENVGRGLK